MTDTPKSLTEAVRFKHGPAMKNRFMLSPLTNLQSQPDGVLSDAEYHWLTRRAAGGFGLTMTCAAHVQAIGQGFPGQLGVFSDRQMAGLERLAAGIRKHNSLALVQLHHAGMRSPADLIGSQPVCPSDNEKTGARAMSHEEVETLIEDFIEAAVRCEKAGFQGAEIHGAHGYILCQFLSADINHRADEFGGSLENRSRPLWRIIEGIRARCDDEFILGVRLSPERFGIRLQESLQTAAALMADERIDFVDMSLWDMYKEPEEEAFQGQSLMSWFTGLERHGTRVVVAGNIRSARAARDAMAAGADIVALGRAGILHHDFPLRLLENPEFEPTAPPVSRAYLENEGLSAPFIDYLAGWKGFVSAD